MYVCSCVSLFSVFLSLCQHALSGLHYFSIEFIVLCMYSFMILYLLIRSVIGFMTMSSFVHLCISLGSNYSIVGSMCRCVVVCLDSFLLMCDCGVCY